MLYERISQRSVGATSQFPALAVPPGVALPVEVAEMLRDVIPSLGLPEAGMVTPWATRKSDFEWQEVVKPDTNIGMFELTDKTLKAANEALFGLPLPFVVVFTGKLQPIAELQRLADPSAYDWYETQAVYRQDDPNPLPAVQYVHWLRVKDVPEMPKSPKSLEQVAKEMGGKLRYAQQVPVESTTIRPAPALSFDQVLNTQATPAVDVVNPPVAVPTQPLPQQPVPVTTATTTTSSAAIGKPSQTYLTLAAVGLGVCVATIALGRALKK